MVPKYILVATPQIAFGELIRISLEEGGNYRVRLVQTSGELLSSANHTNFAMAILDSDLGESSFISLAQTLVEKLPNLRLVVIPPENDPQAPSLTGLKVDGFLSRPFYLPDLIQMIEGLLGPAEDPNDPKDTLEDTQRTVLNTEPLPWMQDVERVSEQLSASLAETSAHELVVVCAGKLWSQAGKLDQQALKEILAAVNRYWSDETKGDMARFVHLEANNCDYLSYTSYLGDGFILVLLYDVGFPLSQIRSETRRISQAFKTQQSKPVAKTHALEPLQAESSSLQAGPQPSSQDQSAQAALGSTESLVPVEEEAETSLLPDDEANLQMNLAALLADMPSPDPENPLQAPESQWVPEISDLAATQDEPVTSIPRFPWEETGGRRVNANQASADIPTSPLKLPATMTEQDMSIKADPSYICILIPCSPQHFLTGELADKLALWVPELCSSFGWRLEGLTVQSEYLQWIVKVAPTVSPNGLIRIIRQNTSIRISSFSDKYHINNSAEDFWAPGYLMARGNQPPAPHLLRAYIDRTRQNQGLASVASETGAARAASETTPTVPVSNS
ncbi:MAG: transposase [Anaerolineaceae bacterium]|nr:transposase [Anaerolineaceae bacterium]